MHALQFVCYEKNVNFFVTIILPTKCLSFQTCREQKSTLIKVEPESLKELFYVDGESHKGARRDERRDERSVKIADLKGNLEAGYWTS